MLRRCRPPGAELSTGSGFIDLEGHKFSDYPCLAGLFAIIPALGLWQIISIGWWTLRVEAGMQWEPFYLRDINKISIVSTSTYSEVLYI
jgi:hypothetical protein